MTEFDAMAFVEEDRDLLSKWIPQAKEPQEVYRLIAQAIFARIGTLDYGRCIRIVKVVLVRPPPAGTLSMRIALVCTAILDKIQTKLPPEDIRSAALWLVGAPKVGPGIVQAILELVPDAETSDAIGRIESKITMLRSTLDARDAQIFDRDLRRLPIGLQMAVRGRQLDAAWCWNEDDGESCRHETITARKLASRFLKEHRGSA